MIYKKPIPITLKYINEIIDKKIPYAISVKCDGFFVNVMIENNQIIVKNSNEKVLIELKHDIEGSYKLYGEQYEDKPYNSAPRGQEADDCTYEEHDPQPARYGSCSTMDPEYEPDEHT